MTRFLLTLVVMLVPALATRHPAKDALATLQRSIPLDLPQGDCGNSCEKHSDCKGTCSWCSARFEYCVEPERANDEPKPIGHFTEMVKRAGPAPPGVPKVMIIGDSWADVVGVGGNQSFFERKLVEHGCHVHSTCLAIPGSTSGLWVKKPVLAALIAAVAAYQPDYVWMTLVGNDALESMPDCAKTGKSAEQCADQLIDTAVPNAFKIVDAIHKGHPAARVTGFG